MSKIWDAYSPKAEELPDFFYTNIIAHLNHMYNLKQMYWQEMLDPGVSEDKLNQISARYHIIDLKLQGMIELLDKCELHAKRNPFRNSYMFPTYDDCEAWEDYLYEKSD